MYVYILTYILAYMEASFPGDGKESSCNARDEGSVLGQESSLEKGITIYYDILTWRIPWTEEPGGL